MDFPKKALEHVDCYTGKIKMAKTTKTYESDIDLTVFKIVGEMTFSEVSEQTRIFFENKPSKLALWDFTLGTVAHLSSQEMREIAKQGAAFSTRIEGARGAILAPKDIDYGMSRVFQVFSEQEIFPLEVKIFRDIDAARKWLIPNA